MKHSSQVCSVSYIGGRKLEVTFTDGVTRELEFHNDWIGYLEPLNKDDFLAKVLVDPVAHTLSWPNEIDLDPDVLHGDYVPATGAYFSVAKEFRLQTS